MLKLLRNTRGATIVEFALVALPVFLFIFGIIQTAWVVWVDNLLYIAVDTAARCGAVQSDTFPCNGSDMVTAANRSFVPLTGTFTPNPAGSSCVADGGSAVVGTYTVTVAFIVNMTLTAQSCYPTVS